MSKVETVGRSNESLLEVQKSTDRLVQNIENADYHYGLSKQKKKKTGISLKKKSTLWAKNHPIKFLVSVSFVIAVLLILIIVPIIQTQGNDELEDDPVERLNGIQKLYQGNPCEDFEQNPCNTDSHTCGWVGEPTNNSVYSCTPVEDPCLNSTICGNNLVCNRVGNTANYSCDVQSSDTLLSIANLNAPTNPCDLYSCANPEFETCSQIDDTQAYMCNPLPDPCTNSIDNTCNFDTQNCIRPNYTSIFDCQAVADPCLSEPCDSNVSFCNRIDLTRNYECLPYPDPCNDVPCDLLISTCVRIGLGLDYTCEPLPDPCLGDNRCNYDTQNCVRNGSTATYECNPVEDPCLNNICNIDTQNCVRLGDTRYFSCEPVPDPCLSNPCNTDTELCQRIDLTRNYSCDPIPDPCLTNNICNPDIQNCVRVGLTSQYTCEAVSNPCDTNPCDLSVSTCDRIDNTRYYSCNPLPNPCDSNPCDFNTRICNRIGETASFTCDPIPNPCDSNPCDSNTQICNRIGETASFTCDPVPNPCDSNPCDSNTQICNRIGETVFFNCDPIPNPCDNNPCNNDERCERIGQTSDFDCIRQAPGGFTDAPPSRFREQMKLNFDRNRSPYSDIRNSRLDSVVEDQEDHNVPHVEVFYDSGLDKDVLQITLHKDDDCDFASNRCDRQRVEFKGWSSSDDEVLGFRGDELAYQWWFKVGNYIASDRFTHIFQLKYFGDGVDSSPLFTLNMANSNGDQWLRAYGGDGDSEIAGDRVRLVRLSQIRNQWVQAYVRVKFDDGDGYIEVKIRDINGNLLGSYERFNQDLWYNNADAMRPKWGLYRDLENDYNDVDTIRISDVTIYKA